MTCRAWCFTINNFSQDDENEVFALSHEAKYLVCGKEFGDAGTPHLQGYVMLHNSVRSLPLSRGHCEHARGSPLQNREYCTKDGDFFENGVCPGIRSDAGLREKEDWTRIRLLAEDRDWETLKVEFPKAYLLHYDKLEKAAIRADSKPVALSHEIRHEWYYGSSGSGKSRQARDLYPNAYIKNPNVKWWDGYNGEEEVIIDDFDKYQVSQAGDMKRWLDIYPFQAEMKGGMKLIRPKKIIVTSNYTIEEIWNDEVTREACNRRVNVTRFQKFF